MGYIYAIRCSEFVKFGFTTNPERRLAEMQCHSPFECEIIGLTNGVKADEAELHRNLAPHKHRGEWFVLNQTVRDLIKDMPLRFEPVRRYRGSGRKWYGDRGTIAKVAA